MASEVISARARVQGAQEVPLVELVPNPRNPRDVLTEIDELADDMRVQGVLQPLLVCSREAFLSGDPGREAELAAGAWVILAGARRHAAATMAELETVPVHVRDDLADPESASRVFTQENGQRVGLTPMQEARLYDELRGRGHSQRRIAEQVGVSHGQVAKRLKLLTLPPEAQDALAAGRIDISAALALSEIDDPAVAAEVVGRATTTHSGGKAVTADDLNYEIKQARHVAWERRTKQDLKERGVKVLKHPPAYNTMIEVPNNKVESVPAGELSAYLSTWQESVNYYRARPAAVTPRPESKAREVDPKEGEWAAATEARAAFIQTLLAGDLSRDDKALAMKVALRMALQEPRWRPLRQLEGWMREVWDLTDYGWAADLDERFLLAAAFGYTLAIDEAEVEDAWLWLRSGSTRAEPEHDAVRRHYSRLVDRGYKLAPTEEELLGAIEAAEHDAEAVDQTMSDAGEGQ